MEYAHLAKALGLVVLQLRTALDLSREQLSQRSGISELRLTEIEDGSPIDFPFDQYFWLAESLGVEASHLMELAEQAAEELHDRKGT